MEMDARAQSNLESKYCLGYTNPTSETHRRNLYPCLYEIQNTNRLRNMNQKTTTISKQTQMVVVAIIAALTAAAPMLGSIAIGQNLQIVMAQQVYPLGKYTAEPADEYNTVSKNNVTASVSPAGSEVKVVNPSKSIEKEFWINTVHIDGMTNLNAGLKCDTCPQNTPTHPPEKPPVNSTIPTGGGFRITEPNNVGAWDFRSFTFSPDQIVVNQGDKVTLHFIGVQGAHHVVEVKGIDTFELARGQIHTVSFTANSPGTITYICHVHLPNMVGQILVLPKAGV
jgi:plastocyanin